MTTLVKVAVGSVAVARMASPCGGASGRRGTLRARRAGRSPRESRSRPRPSGARERADAEGRGVARPGVAAASPQPASLRGRLARGLRSGRRLARDSRGLLPPGALERPASARLAPPHGERDGGHGHAPPPPSQRRHHRTPPRKSNPHRPARASATTSATPFRPVRARKARAARSARDSACARSARHPGHRRPRGEPREVVQHPSRGTASRSARRRSQSLLQLGARDELGDRALRRRAARCRARSAARAPRSAAAHVARMPRTRRARGARASRRMLRARTPGGDRRPRLRTSRAQPPQPDALAQQGLDVGLSCPRPSSPAEGAGVPGKKQENSPRSAPAQGAKGRSATDRRRRS